MWIVSSGKKIQESEGIPGYFETKKVCVYCKVLQSDVFLLAANLYTFSIFGSICACYYLFSLSTYLCVVFDWTVLFIEHYVEGAPMGSSLSYTITNILINHFEKKAVVSTSNWFADSDMLIISLSCGYTEKKIWKTSFFHWHLNSIYPNITVTRENALPLLDISVTRSKTNSTDNCTNCKWRPDKLTDAIQLNYFIQRQIIKAADGTSSTHMAQGETTRTSKNNTTMHKRDHRMN